MSWKVVSRSDFVICVNWWLYTIYIIYLHININDSFICVMLWRWLNPNWRGRRLFVDIRKWFCCSLLRLLGLTFTDILARSIPRYSRSYVMWHFNTELGQIPNISNKINGIINRDLCFMIIFIKAKIWKLFIIY